MELLSSLVIRYIMYGLLGTVIFGAYTGYIWMKGDEHGSEKLTAHILKENAAATRLVTRQEEKKLQIQTVVQTKIKEIRVKGDTIIKEVPIYVTKIDDSGCVIPNGFVRLHTAASKDTTPGPPSDSDRASSPYTLSELETVDVANLTTLATCRAKLAGVVSFYKQLQELRK